MAVKPLFDHDELFDESKGGQCLSAVRRVSPARRRLPCPKAYPWKGFAIKSLNRLTASFSVTRASFQR